MYRRCIKVGIYILTFILLKSSIGQAQFCFVENAKDRGIDFVQVNGSKEKEYIVEAKGAGVAAVDVNGDGWEDVYLVNGTSIHGDAPSPAPVNRLYLNQGDGTFKDGTQESGLGDPGFGTGAYFADIDNDGDLDCYLTNFGPNSLYLNDGKGHFTLVPGAGGAQNDGWSTGVAFADINGDDFLDLYVGQYAEFSTEIANKKGKLGPYYGFKAFIGPSSFQPAQDNLFLNNGDGTFIDETKKRGINSFDRGRAFSVFFTDLDLDGDLDLYVANDSTYNQLYENNGKGFYEDISLLAGIGLSQDGREQGSMGLAIGDSDGDLDLDIFVNNYDSEYNILYRNDGDLQFTDSTYPSHIGQGTMKKVSFGLLLEDFDNDGWPDLHVCNGHVYPVADKVPTLDGYEQADLFFHNLGKGNYKNVSDLVGPASKLKGVSRGSATADFDHDGDLDIVINNLDRAPFFLENKSSVGNWIQIAAQNERGMPAYGARLIVESNLRSQIAELHSGASFLSQSSPVMHFGLGKDMTVKKITVRWPDGTTSELSTVKANQRMIIRKKSER